MAEFTGVIGVPSSGFTLRVVYSYSQNVTANTSTVTATGYVKRNNSTYHPYNTTSTVSISINGNAKTEHPSYKINADGYYQMISHSATVSHNADGSKSIGISFSMNGQLSNWYPNGSISSTIALPTIPRASTITLSPTSVTLGSPIAISINRASSAFTHTLQHDFAVGSWTDFSTGATTSATLNTSLDWAVRIPTQTSASGRIRCLTYNGSSLIGEKIYNFTANVPAAVIPTISEITVEESVEGLAEKFGAFIQGKSIPKVTINAAGTYGSSITTYITSVSGTSYPGSTFTTGVLTASGPFEVETAVTDTRGRTATKSITLSVVPYFSPTISLFTIERCNSDGTLNTDGTYVKIAAAGEIADCNSKNTNNYKIEYKPTSSSNWITLLSGSDYKLNLSQVKTISGGFDITKSYDFKLTVSDYFTSTSLDKSIPTSFTLMNWNNSGKGLGIGKVSEKNALEVDIPAEFSKTLKVKNKELSTLIVVSEAEPDADTQTIDSFWLKI